MIVLHLIDLLNVERQLKDGLSWLTWHLKQHAYQAATAYEIDWWRI